MLLQVEKRSLVQALSAYQYAKAAMLCPAARKTSQQSRGDITSLHTGTGEKVPRGNRQIEGVNLKARAFRQSGKGQVHWPKVSLLPWEEASFSKTIILSSVVGSIFSLTENGTMEDQAELKQMPNFQVPVFSLSNSTHRRFHCFSWIIFLMFWLSLCSNCALPISSQ